MMVRRWVKLLPYFVVMRIVKDISYNDSWEHEGDTFGVYCMDEGEYILFSDKVARKRKIERLKAELDRMKAGDEI